MIDSANIPIKHEYTNIQIYKFVYLRYIRIFVESTL